MRRERFGHIALAWPVVHVWFRPVLAHILGIPPRTFDEICECKAYMVLNEGKRFEKGQVIGARDYFEYRAGCRDDRSLAAMTGGGLVRKLVTDLDLETTRRSLEQRERNRMTERRLFLLRTLLSAGTKPEHMIIDLLPVIPPALRPVLVMEDGTIVTDDLNELYSRVLHRNTRLKRMAYYGAPDLLLNECRRALQAAVDALFHNGKRSTLFHRGGGKPLKSLADRIQTKEGILRGNLLGKRVDYSGRSVITSGPWLKLHQCGLPVGLAMDLFKPFVYGRLLRKGYAYSLSNAKRIVEARRVEAMEALEEEMADVAVLLNRAPSLHRLSFQAFEPVLVEGKAIRLHPLVCSGFNADFDGDQMGVHLPLSVEARLEAQVLMLSVNNLLSPANGKIAMFPSQDIVLGLYYLTKEKDVGLGEGKCFTDREEVGMALESGCIDVHSGITVRIGTERIRTTAGRVLLGQVLPAGIPFSEVNKTMRKNDVGKLIDVCFETCGRAETIRLLDELKALGFEWATRAGISLCVDDITVPKDKEAIIGQAQDDVKAVAKEYALGLITEGERHNRIVDIWMKTSDRLADVMMKNLGVTDPEGLGERERNELKEFNSLWMMADSGARGSKEQIRQVGAMRGLMAKPTGEIVEIPITNNLKEGLTYHEYLLAAHGARKGRADGALKTANAGYFTRRLIDAAHDVVIQEIDCGGPGYITMTALTNDDDVIIPLRDQIWGRVAASAIRHPVTQQVLVRKGAEITKRLSDEIEAAGILGVPVRSTITCLTRDGVCAKCYGYDLTTRALAVVGDAVGIVAAQSVGEPGTQLTLRTFHNGGTAAGGNIRSSVIAKAEGVVVYVNVKHVVTRDNRRVVVGRSGRIAVDDGVMIRECGSVPYGATTATAAGVSVTAGTLLAEWDPFNIPLLSLAAGEVRYEDVIPGVTMNTEVDPDSGVARRFVVHSTGSHRPLILVAGKEHVLRPGSLLFVNQGDSVGVGDVLAKVPKHAAKSADITGGLSRVLDLLEGRRSRDSAHLAYISGEVRVPPQRGNRTTYEIVAKDGTKVSGTVNGQRQLNVQSGELVEAGDILVDGQIEPADVLAVLGVEASARFLIDEVQKIYRGQGVEINDKHFEIIVRKMLGKVTVVKAGASGLVPGDVVGKDVFLEANRRTRGKKATARPILLGITKVALESESWLSAASFQRTSGVLVNAAIRKKIDELNGLKENVIIGKLLPIGTGHLHNRKIIRISERGFTVFPP